MSYKDFRRFRSKFKLIDGECWIWHGTINADGYGSFWHNPSGKNVRAHRYMFENFIGPIPDGMLVCHRCDVPLCVNPEHLFLGFPKDNTQDMIAKGRRPSVPGLRAHRSPRARLTWEKAREIRRLREGGLIYQKISEIIGVSDSLVAAVCLGQTWRPEDEPS